MRFQLKIYKKRKPKGKPIFTCQYNRPMAARMAQVARDAVYYEIVDLRDYNRIIEIKPEVTNGDG